MSFTCITDPAHINHMRILCLAQGCEMYAEFKMIPTRGATATWMLKEAGIILGRKFKRGGHAEAALALRAMLAS